MGRKWEIQMKKNIALFAALVLLAGGAGLSKGQAKMTEFSLNGHWIMHIYLRNGAGKPVLFEDELQVTTGADGKPTGSLTVPNRFTVPMRNILINGNSMSFDIEADEGRGPFHVKYEGSFHPDGDTFVGFGTVTDDGSLLGGFVGQRLND